MVLKILPSITDTFDGVMLANTTRQRDGLNSKIKYKRWLEWQTIIPKKLTTG